MTEDISMYQKNKMLFIWVASLTLFFAAVEIIYGFISGSLMMMGDGVHMSSDAISLILSLIATIMATKAATKNKTFGYKRFEPIAAFINGLSLVMIPVFIIAEAISRIISPIEIIPNQMLVVGTIGLVINGIVGYILTKASSNLNVKSALLHVLADLITSVSVVIAALGIKYFGFTWLDPIGSILTSIIIIAGGYKITKEAFNILMEGTPKGYSVDEIGKIVKSSGQPIHLNTIKIWCINESEIYTLVDVTSPSREENALAKIREKIASDTDIPLENIYVNMS
ncbi:Cadmium, cobalt and zinc/H(+)-K(+) antiporter [Bhargavaea cecembensis DSE10]|uniref:Cadmium, cobalt and zinc/H(+)-K(+) antiporter n=1 Tax=Bhargavaea cecembensis DSE10 TaxID=1235279 RepID=M7NUJ5_9BACL|nr:cation diffusion facilitator family transporter [Bhargavaea cecembensis]EMR05320.1 Cadmium, cobalt and zinc/H(+)-K(+) antiporter [Bhargavaea cecembensis DSE10]